MQSPDSSRRTSLASVWIPEDAPDRLSETREDLTSCLLFAPVYAGGAGARLTVCAAGDDVVCRSIITRRRTRLRPHLQTLVYLAAAVAAGAGVTALRPGLPYAKNVLLPRDSLSLHTRETIPPVEMLTEYHLFTLLFPSATISRNPGGQKGGQSGSGNPAEALTLIFRGAPCPRHSVSSSSPEKSPNTDSMGFYRKPSCTWGQEPSWHLSTSVDKLTLSVRVSVWHLCLLCSVLYQTHVPKRP